MGRRALDLTGQRFGRLTALRPVGSGAHGIAWLCRCACGNTKRALAGSLRSGHTSSCGCLFLEMAQRAKPRATRNRDRARAMYLAGRTCGQIAAELGLSRERVCQYLRDEIDMVASKAERLRQKQMEILHAAQAARPRSELAAELGMTTGALGQAISRLRRDGFGVPRPSPRSRGPKPSTTEVISRYQAGEQPEDIAKALGMRLATVCHALYMHAGTSRRHGAAPYRPRKGRELEAVL